MIKIQTTRITIRGEFVGWKVYLDGEKYPKKPINHYSFASEKLSVIRAFEDAGLDPTEVQDIIFDEPAEV